MKHQETRGEGESEMKKVSDVRDSSSLSFFTILLVFDFSTLPIILPSSEFARGQQDKKEQRTQAQRAL